MDARLMLAEENSRLATTLQHYRNWASQILARYQMVNPDAAKPPRRIYVGGLPPGTTEVCFFLPSALFFFIIFYAAFSLLSLPF